MATSTVYARTTDSWTGRPDPIWANARGDASTSGTGYNNFAQAYSFGVYNIYTGGRGSTLFSMRRSFFEFDLIGERKCISAEVKLYLGWLGAGIKDTVVLVAATPLEGSTADYGNVFSSGSVLGAAYSSGISVSPTAGYHTFTMTAAAIADINSAAGSGGISMGLMGDSFDYQNIAPSLGGDYAKVYVRYSDYASTGSDPKLILTHPPDDAIFFGANF